jgi:hypothetical protein
VRPHFQQPANRTWEPEESGGLKDNNASPILSNEPAFRALYLCGCVPAFEFAVAFGGRYIAHALCRISDEQRLRPL